MGILDSLKEGAKKLADTVKENYQRSQAIKNWKTAVVRTLTFPQIKQLCNEYGSSPKPYEIDPLTGKKEKRTLDRDAYEDFVINEIPSKFILKFVQEHHIDVPPYPEFEKEEKATQQIQQETPVKTVAKEEAPIKQTTTKATEEGTPQIVSKPSDFELVLNYIDTEFRELIGPQEVANEDHFQSILITALRTKFPNMNIKDVKAQHNRGDITIDDKYVLELKYANNENTLNKGLKEIKDYYNYLHYKDVGVIILNVGMLPENKINDYVEYYRRDGAKVLVLNAKAKPTSKKDTYYVIKK